MMRRNCRVFYNLLFGFSFKWIVFYEGLGKLYFESVLRIVFFSWNGVFFFCYYIGMIIYWSLLYFWYLKVEFGE